MLKAIPLFKPFERIAINHLPRIYISNNDYLSKQKASDETDYSELAADNKSCSVCAI